MRAFANKYGYVRRADGRRAISAKLEDEIWISIDHSAEKARPCAVRRKFTTVVIHTCACMRTQMPTLIRSSHTRSSERSDSPTIKMMFNNIFFEAVLCKNTRFGDLLLRS